MGLNFMGLGFNFGARDTGLEHILGQLTSQFALLNTSLQSLSDTSKDSLTPAEGAVLAVADHVDSLNQKVREFGASATAAFTDVVQMSRGVGDAWNELDLSEAADTGAVSQEMTKGLSILTPFLDSLDSELKGLSDSLRAMAEASQGAGDGLVESAQEGATGVGRMANSILSGAGKVTGAMGWIGMAIGPIISGFGSAAESAGGFVEAVTGLPARVGNQLHRLTSEGINLTNSLEGEAVGLGQTARQIGANMGYLGDSLRRVTGRATGMAMGLNIGADEAVRAIQAWEQETAALGATGLESERDVARLNAALGVDAGMLRNVTGEMEALSFSPAMIRQVTSSLVEFGTQTNDVAAALNQLPALAQTMERRRILGDSPEQMQQFVVDTAAAATALYSVTHDSERAMQAAQELGQTMTDARHQFHGMFAGVQTELPGFIQNFSIVSGSVDEAFEVMQQGPGGLIEGLARLTDATRRGGGDVGQMLSFMQQRMQETLPESSQMIQLLFETLGDGSEDAVTALMQSVRTADHSLGELARSAHSTGRTLDEMFERMRAGFQTAFRRIARPAVRDFVRDTGRELQRLRRSMSEAANSGGALGTAMETLSLASQIGGLALLPRELRSGAVAADELYGMVTPLITSFTTWGGLLDTIGTYIALFATRVIEAKTSTNTWSDAIDQVSNQFADVFIRWLGDAERFLVQFSEGFANFNWDNLFGGTGSQGTLAGAFQRVLTRLRDIDWGRVWANLQEGFNDLFDRISPWLEQKWNQLKTILQQLVRDWWDSIDWAAVIGDLGDLASALWDAIQPALSQAMADIGDWLSEHWPEVVIGAMLAFGAALLLLLGGLVVAAVAIFFGPLIAQFAYIWAWLNVGWREWGDDITAFFSSWWDEISEFPAEFGRTFMALWTDITDWFGGIWEDVSGFFGEVWAGLRSAVEGVANFFTGLWEGVSSWFRGLWEGIVSFFSTQWDRIASIPERVVASLQALWQGYIQWFTRTFPQTAQAIVEVAGVWQERFEDIRDFAVEVWENITSGVEDAVEWIGDLFGDLRDGLVTIGNRILGFVRQTVDRIVGRFERARDSILAVWSIIRQGIAMAISYVRTTYIDPFLDRLTSGFNAVQSGVSTAWATITTTISTAVSYLRETYIDPFLSRLENGWNTISERATAAWTMITNIADTVGGALVEVPGRLRTAWEGLIGLFGGIFQRISETVRNALPAFNDLASGATTALDAIMSTVIRLFGHSVHTVVGEDMAATQEVMTETAEAVSDTMRTILYDATVSAIVEGFQHGFAVVVEDMETFAEDMVGAFTSLAEQISQIFTSLFTAIVSQAEITMLATETAVEGIIGRLRTITEAQAALAEAREAAVESLSRPDDEAAMRRRLAEIGGSEVLQAIHYPDWYGGGGGQTGYERLFVAKMNELHAAIIALGVAPGTGGIEARRQLITAAAERVAEARVGGHPNMPGRGRGR